MSQTLPTLFTLFAQLDAQLEAMRATHQEAKRLYLAEYAERHRKYTNGYSFVHRLHTVTITSVLFAVDDSGRVSLAYGLSRSGEPFDTIPEENIPEL